MNKAFKKFMNPFGIGWAIGLVLPGFLIVAALLKLILEQDVEMIITMAIMAVPFVPALIRLIRSRKFFAAMKDEHLCQSMEQDFDQAMPMRKNSIKFGEQYVFLKRSGRILKYSEITQVYQYIHKTNGVEDQRLLKYVDAKGKTRKMCKLDLKGKSDIELTTILTLLLKKNPDIKVGYR